MDEFTIKHPITGHAYRVTWNWSRFDDEPEIDTVSFDPDFLEAVELIASLPVYGTAATRAKRTIAEALKRYKSGVSLDTDSDLQDAIYDEIDEIIKSRKDADEERNFERMELDLV